MALFRKLLGLVSIAYLSLYLSIVRANPVSSAEATTLGERVLRTLLSTPLGKTVPPFAYTVTLSQRKDVNAWARGSGKLQIDDGILPVLDQEAGAWAAVISHEIGHFVIYKGNEKYLPPFRREAENAYHRTAAGEHEAGLGEALLSAPLGRGLASLPLSQEKEYEADRVGLLLMAEAGYHPDFAFAVYNRMGWRLHNSGWGARQNHLMEAYAVALAIFQSRWPEPAQSPGGNPPPVGGFGVISFTPDAKDRSVMFRAGFHVRNAAGREVRVVAVFQQGDALVQAALPEYRSPDGSLELNATLPGASELSTDVSLTLPAAAVAGIHRRLRAVFYLIVGGEQLDISKFVAVELPEQESD